MDDAPCRRFFLEPEQTFHRRYEALRALFVEGRPLEETAAEFGYRVAALRSMASRFRAACRRGQGPPFFFPMDVDALRVDDAVKISRGPNCRRLPIAAN
jgi:hypothetical protein